MEGIDMVLNSNNMDKANALVNEINAPKPQNVKRIRREQGLLERDMNNSDKVILAEDNRQVLFG